MSTTSITATQAKRELMVSAVDTLKAEYAKTSLGSIRFFFNAYVMKTVDTVDAFEKDKTLVALQTAAKKVAGIIQNSPNATKTELEIALAPFYEALSARISQVTTSHLTCVDKGFGEYLQAGSKILSSTMKHLNKEAKLEGTTSGAERVAGMKAAQTVFEKTTLAAGLRTEFVNRPTDKVLAPALRAVDKNLEKALRNSTIEHKERHLVDAKEQLTRAVDLKHGQALRQESDNHNTTDKDLREKMLNEKIQEMEAGFARDKKKLEKEQTKTKTETADATTAFNATVKALFKDQKIDNKKNVLKSGGVFTQLAKLDAKARTGLSTDFIAALDANKFAQGKALNSKGIKAEFLTEVAKYDAMDISTCSAETKALVEEMRTLTKTLQTQDKKRSELVEKEKEIETKLTELTKAQANFDKNDRAKQNAAKMELGDRDRAVTRVLGKVREDLKKVEGLRLLHTPRPQLTTHELSVLDKFIAKNKGWLEYLGLVS